MFSLLTFFITALIITTSTPIDSSLVPILEIPKYNLYSITSYRSQQETRKQFHDSIKILLNNTIDFDGTTHLLLTKKLRNWDKINKMETEFEKVIRMIGVKYDYKRDMFWRTWRDVTFANGTDNTVIFYKYQSIINETCKHCYDGIFWVIEEPPCPYEFLSVINKDKLCAISWFQLNNITSKCPLLISFSDLNTCDNPIVTKYKLRRIYNKVSERRSTVMFMCKWREDCEFSTFYAIFPEFILFQIINSTNHIIYSRIMRSGRKNYVCIENCGYMDPNSKKNVKNYKSLRKHLLDKLPKTNKIDDHFLFTVNSSVGTLQHHISREKLAGNVEDDSKPRMGQFSLHSIINKIKVTTNLNKEFDLNVGTNEFSDSNILFDVVTRASTTISNCKRLEKEMDEYYGSESEDYYYLE
ncbi:uncharacterized protein LOC113520889 [Galleria mellonella]|uniref:Uncharacterized protein LOC113520889 n=1 Tax=Galleria mellonella TaxID=7137 RepID=A0A6J3C780_GALME|nr:uncharacterized protein LOC113520889 [Galleria mellonella]